MLSPPKTFLQQFDEASLVVFGKFTNPQLPKDDISGGTTDFVVKKVLKEHKVLGDRKVFTVRRYVPKTKNKYLLFCNTSEGKIDPFYGVEVSKKGNIVKYLKGNLARKDQPVSTRLKYCFKFMDNPEPEISLDAYREFAKADYKAYRSLARKLPADKIAGWLTDPETPSYRIELYALLLGHCGKDRHAELLRQLLNNPKKRSGTGADGILEGYTLLKPKQGWSFLRKQVLGQPKESFSFRYAGLRAVRFFWEQRPDVIKKTNLLKGVCRLLKKPDMADIVIEDLRKWKCWKVSDRVIALANKKSYDFRSMRRAILRYALSCPPKYTKAADFVKRERRKHKEDVADVEELLKQETETPPN
jgi:hypothetical protein